MTFGCAGASSRCGRDCLSESTGTPETGKGLIAPNLILCVKAIGGPLEFNIEVTPIEDAY